VKSQRRGEVCRAVIQLLRDNNIDFLVGGAYALAHYTGITRDTKDFDLFLRPADVAPALAIWQKAGYTADYTFTHWLAKVKSGRVSRPVRFYLSVEATSDPSGAGESRRCRSRFN
jgi:hypothetical protein